MGRRKGRDLLLFVGIGDSSISLAGEYRGIEAMGSSR